MRIFERLRGKDRNESGIERNLVESILGDVLHRLDEEGPKAAANEPKQNCCTCCSAQAEYR